MILNFFLAIVTHIFDFIFGFLPTATIAAIPVIGADLYDMLVFTILKWNAFEATFPYATAVWQVFLFVFIPFELSILVVNLILGSRTPVRH